jgi:saccharopine dehydrogenase (NAD+, L-lysine-forming)
MKALVLGCGEMGSEVIKDLYRYANLDEIVIGTRTPAKAEKICALLAGRNTRLTVMRADAGDPDMLVSLMKGVDVAVNSVGPNYKYELPIARAAIRAGVDLVDMNDEYEITFKMFEISREAHDAGITIIFGLGGSPGINNVLVRAAANQFDDVEEIHTAWVMSALDPGGPALSMHLLYSLSGPALTFDNGRLIEVQSFVDGKERITFPPPVGPLDVFHVGHPEPIMFSRSYPGIRYADDKATFNPPEINDLIVMLGKLIRAAGGPIHIDGREIDIMDFAASYLHQACRRKSGVPPEAALYIQVKGKKEGKTRKAFFSSVSRLAPATGIPASIGAIMLLQGTIQKKGAMPPEQCIEADDFLYEILTRRNLATLNGWIED